MLYSSRIYRPIVDDWRAAKDLASEDTSRAIGRRPYWRLVAGMTRTMRRTRYEDIGFDNVRDRPTVLEGWLVRRYMSSMKTLRCGRMNDPALLAACQILEYQNELAFWMQPAILETTPRSPARDIARFGVNEWRRELGRLLRERLDDE